MTLIAFGPEAVVYDDGSFARHALVDVVLRNTSTHVSLFADAAGNMALANPVPTDSSGNLFFYAAPGEYDIIANGGRVPIDVDSSLAVGKSVASFSQKGPISVTTGTVPFIPPFAATVQGVRLGVASAPVGADIIVQVKVNGVPMFTTGARPRILNGNTDATEVAPDALTTLAAGDHVTVDIVQVGSTSPGTSLAVSLRYLPL